MGSLIQSTYVLFLMQARWSLPIFFDVARDLAHFLVACREPLGKGSYG